MNGYIKELSRLISEVRDKVPLVHQITNYVTVNDCANITLAIGASPIMADDIAEAADITSISSSLVLNIGTLNDRTIKSMLAAGKRANELDIPVVFDPVGAGASGLRSEATERIISEVRLSVLRGNISEVSFVAGLQSAVRGVDASAQDAGGDAGEAARKASRLLGCVAAVTGAVDAVSDGSRTVRIHNGHKMLSRVTGTGCMSTALTGVFAGTTRDMLSAAAAGIAIMGIAGEIAYEKAGDNGSGSFRSAIIDAVSLMDGALFEQRAKIYEA